MAKKKKAAAKKRPRTARSTASRAADRARVSSQPAELAYVARKFGVSKQAVTAAIAKVGNQRAAIYAALKTQKVRSKAADRARVSSQAHEVAYLAKKVGTTRAAVLTALKTHGTSRRKVEAALRRK